MSGTWVVWCETCDSLSETLHDQDEIVEHRRSHPWHKAGLAGTSKEGLTAGEFVKYIPEQFKWAYWERKVDLFFAQEGVTSESV